MPVVYGGMHSVMFIRLSDSTTKHSWTDLHLIPESRPVIALPEPKIQLIEIPGRSKRIDLTDYMPGGLTYGPRSGEFTFFVDHDQWNGWKNAYNELSTFFNGDKFAVYLMDNVSSIYEGRVYLAEYNTDGGYSVATLHYELEPEIVDGYVTATFKDSASFGGTILQEVLLKKNTVPQFSGTLPQHSGYAFERWHPNIYKIKSDTTYTALYRSVPVEGYQISFADWDGTVLKSSKVNDGEMPVPPNNPTRERYIFTGWSPEITIATYSVRYTATYVEDPNPITTTLEDVNKRIKDGTYSSYYRIRDRVRLVIDDEYDGYAEVAGINADVDENNTAIPMTFITSGVLNTSEKMFSGNSEVGGYKVSDLKDYVDTLEYRCPLLLRNMIIAASKTSHYYYNGGATGQSTMRLWIPSFREVYGFVDSVQPESRGPIYDQLFTDSNSTKVKRLNGTAKKWWLRTQYNDTNFYGVGSSGSYDTISSSSTGYIALGFCVGAERKSRTDPTAWNETWEQVKSSISDNSYKTKYIVGDTLPLTFSVNGTTEYSGRVIIAGIDTDEDRNGNKIPLSLITVSCLNTMHSMNSSDTAAGGYPASLMKTYIDGLESSLPSTLQSMLTAAKKTSKQSEPSSTTLTAYHKLWIPSYREMIGDSSYESSGIVYDDINLSSYISSSTDYWLRSSGGSNTFALYSNALVMEWSPSELYGVVLGFCVGASTT